MMKNFPVNVNGKEYWISRAVAGVLFVFKKKGNKVYCLTEVRGKGAADEQGKHCVVCGYLDYNETLPECVAREAKEETGFIVGDVDKIKFAHLNSDPSENRQNVTAHYIYWAEENEDFDERKAQGGEKDEVETVKWYEVGTLGNDGTLYVNIYDIMADEWAFDHDTLIIKYLSIEFNKLSYDEEKEKKRP